VSHEIGQWCAYPDFDEIDKYTGYFKARNFELFRDQAERHGLLPQARDFLMASGRLQVLAYKHDIEAALRTPGFGGFQLLDLHDFPGQGTALVGVLDAFWDSKPYCTPEEYASFCAPTVPLIRAPKHVLTTGDSFTAQAELAHFGPRDLTDCALRWSLSHGERELASGAFPASNYATGELHRLGSIEIPLAQMPAPAQLKLSLGAEDGSFANQWDLFVFPAEQDQEIPDGVSVHDTLEAALEALERGESVLWLPPVERIRNDPNHPLEPGFSPIFWNTAWTNWQAPHTLGLLCDPGHPALEHFPTEYHSNWQWWEIMTGSQPFLLTHLRKLRPIVQPIDDWFNNRKLGLVIEARVGKGKLIACATDLTHDLDQRPAARQLRTSLLDYLVSDRFQPSVSLTADDLRSLMIQPPTVSKLGATIRASSSEKDYPASHAIDGMTSTLWHTEFEKRQPTPPHDLVLEFPQPVSISTGLLTQRLDRTPNGQVKEVVILGADGKQLGKTVVPSNAEAHPLALPKGTTTERLTVRILSGYGEPFAALAEVDVVVSPE
jgi:hypothetical protein